MNFPAFIILTTFLMTSCSILPPKEPQDIAKKDAVVADYSGEKEVGTFAGGCFWCTESDFEKVDGVIAAVSGYAGGELEHPTYQHHAGHREAVQVTFDPSIISYKELVEDHFRHIDPTDNEGQFVDRGFQYSSAIFTHSDEQKNIAEAVKKELDSSGTFDTPIVTEVLPYTTFYPAEDYHQDYYKKSPIRYNFYRHGSGRDQFLEEVWGEKEE
jgi:peptide methionine sulfoxide reductase msrA/msrB